MIKRTCEYCKKELKFDNGWQFGAHKVNCEFYPHRARRIKRIASLAIKPKKIYKFQCLKCNADYQLKLTDYKFSNGKYSKWCSIKCSHSRYWSEEARHKKSIANKGQVPWNAGKIVVSRENRVCQNPNCQLIFIIERYTKRKYCSAKCSAWNNGGLRPNSGKHGSWYYCKHLNKDVYLDSTWELELAKWLDNQNITWSRGVSYKWIDTSKKEHKYYPDFVLIESGRILDIKNRFLEIRDKEKIERVMKQNKIVVEIINRSKLDEILRA